MLPEAPLEDFWNPRVSKCGSVYHSEHTSDTSGDQGVEF